MKIDDPQPLSDARRETFCQLFAVLGSPSYGNRTESAKLAGYSERSAYSQGSDLMKRSEIIDRVAQLQREQANRNLLSADKILCDLENQRQRAVEAGKISDANRASELQAKILGVLGERQQASPSDDVPDRDPAEREALQEFIQGRLGLVSGDGVTQRQLDGMDADTAQDDDLRQAV